MNFYLIILLPACLKEDITSFILHNSRNACAIRALRRIKVDGSVADAAADCLSYRGQKLRQPATCDCSRRTRQIMDAWTSGGKIWFLAQWRGLSRGLAGGIITGWKEIAPDWRDGLVTMKRGAAIPPWDKPGADWRGTFWAFALQISPEFVKSQNDCFVRWWTTPWIEPTGGGGGDRRWPLINTWTMQDAPANTRRCPNVVLMSGRRRRRRPNIKTT